MPEELWTEVCNIVQEVANKTTPNKQTHQKESKKKRWLSEEALQIVEEWREVKNKGEREMYMKLNTEFQKIAGRDKKAFFNEQCLTTEENKRGKVLEMSSEKHQISREHSAQRWAQ